jgi:hypothetical protein
MLQFQMQSQETQGKPSLKAWKQDTQMDTKRALKTDGPKVLTPVVRRRQKGIMTASNEKKKLNLKSLILFKSKSSRGSFLGDSFKAEFALYHLSLKFSPESTTAYTLCDSLKWINWASELYIISPDELPRLSQYGIICKQCEEEARNTVFIPQTSLKPEDYDSDGNWSR